MPRSTSLSLVPIGCSVTNLSACQPIPRFGDILLEENLLSHGVCVSAQHGWVTCDTTMSCPAAYACPFSRGLVITGWPAWCRGPPKLLRTSCFLRPHFGPTLGFPRPPGRGTAFFPGAGRRGWTVWRREWATGPREECRIQALPSDSSSPTSSHACAFFEISTFWRIPQSPPLTWGLFLGPGANTDVKRLIWR